MPISDILARGTGRLSNQDIASLALEADRERRCAIMRGAWDKAIDAKRERDKLLAALED